MSTTIIACPKCGQKLRVPNDRGTLLVTCPNGCGQFDFVGWSRAVVPAAGPAKRADAARSDVVTVGREPPSLPAAAFGKFGQVRQRTEAPTQALKVVLPFMCSDTARPFTVTLAKDRLGEPFHVKSLEPAAEYQQLLKRGGYTVQAKAGKLLDLDDADFVGFQCYHCGAGQRVGDRFNWVQCGVCNTAYCSNRVEAIHGGGFKSRCPVCQVWSTIGTEVAQSLGGSFFLVDKDGSHPPPALPPNDRINDSVTPGLFTRLTRLLT